MLPKVTIPPVVKEPVEDYAEILEPFDLRFNENGIYYEVGKPEKVQGWILHLSCVWPQVPDMLNTILPLLVAHKIPFKVAQNKGKTEMLCNGSLGYHQLSKVFCLYPETDALALTLAKKLLAITQDFQGGAIPTDFHLGGTLYTRYGSFNPQLYLDDTGRVERYILDANRQWIKDEYTTPFRFPKGIPWPFGEIAAPVQEVPSTFLKDSYKIFKTLKNDAKGRVMKSLRWNGLKVEWIIIKEAKKGVFLDEEGRDNRNRLQWQYHLQRDLEGKIPIPKVYDFFEENGNSYLVMEYIKGRPLSNVIGKIYQSSVWSHLDADKKLLLVDYLLQLVDTIDTMHQEGYVHRDINPVNFILDRQGKFVAIDLELAYSLRESTPHPPFTLGTPGFMSPEQQAVKAPEVKQDIYSLGAVMISCFTNLSPAKFAAGNPELPDRLNFFIDNQPVSDLIGACLSIEPEKRPGLNVIKSTLQKFREALDIPGPVATNSAENIGDAIAGLIHALGNSELVKPGRVWHSNTTQENEQLANIQTGICYNTGYYSGVSGVMYALALAKCKGYNVDATEDIYLRSLHFLQDNFLNVLPNVIPGLYHGAAGVAVALAKGIKARLIDPEYRSSIEKCLDLPTDTLNIAQGVAGQGWAVLQCLDLLEPEVTDRILQRCVTTLLDNQQKNGSWLSPSPAGGCPIRFTGFSQGVAGICCFLLEHQDRYPDGQVEEAVVKALRWLIKRSKKSKKGFYWWITDSKKSFNWWLEDGTAGIALSFIHAYKVLEDPAYKKIAEGALQTNASDFVHPDFTLAHGITGLAETYLTAARVFENEVWQQRADFILSVLMQVYRGGDQSTCHWVMEDHKSPTADLMVGNGGILHFLLRHQS